MLRARPLLFIAATAATLALAACGGTDPVPPGVSEETPSADSAYLTPGKITIATGEPAYFPYVIDDAPESGEGFEAAVAYAVAEELGFAASDVVWVRTTFDEAIAPGPKNFDLNIQQYTISDERKQSVDFSSPYYAASQAIVSINGYAADGVDSLAGLKELVIGAMVGTTSAQTAEEAIDPTNPVQLYNTNEDVRSALEAGQVDAIVLDLPTAFFTSAALIENSYIVGELPGVGVPDEWGFVLTKNSPLTAEVTAALDKLRSSGKLQQITDRWLGADAGVPKLK